MKELIFNIIRKKLYYIARLIIWRHKPEVVGVTGNVGKTSTKVAIQEVLSHSKKVRCSKRYFDVEMNMILAILGDWEHGSGFFFWTKVLFSGFINIFIPSSKYPEILILEYGVERPGDMKRLLNLVRPKVGILTAIGDVPVHVEFFAGKEAVLREKSKIISQLPVTGFAVLNADEEDILEVKEKTRAHVVTFGFSDEADVRISSFERSFSDNFIGSTFKINYGGSFIPVRMNMVIGKAQAYAAAAAAAATGISFGMNLVDISEALGEYKSPQGRMNVLYGIKNSFIIDDTYDASLLSTEEALDALKALKVDRKIAVIGDMMEIGKYTFEAHEYLGINCAKMVDVLITVGNKGKIISDAAESAKGKKRLQKENVHHFEDTEEAALFLQDIINENDLILIKGSELMEMEKIVKEIMAEPERAAELLVKR